MFFLEKPDIYRSITFDAAPTTLSGCDNSIFLVIPDWYANGCCRVLAQTLYLVIKIRLIKYWFLKSIFTLRGKKRSTIAIYKQSTPTFLSAISAIMFHDMSDTMIYQLNYGIEYLGLGKVMWYQQKVSTQIARISRTYVVCG